MGFSGLDDQFVHILFQAPFDSDAGHFYTARHIYERLVSQTLAYGIPVLPVGFIDDHFQG